MENKKKREGPVPCDVISLKRKKLSELSKDSEIKTVTPCIEDSSEM